MTIMHDKHKEIGMTMGDQMGNAAQADEAFLASKLQEGCEASSLPGGVERFLTVSNTAIRENLDREYHGRKRMLPTMVVRERVEGQLQVVGVFRHVEVLGPSQMERVPPGQRFTKTNGDEAIVVMATTAPLRVYVHPDDEKMGSQADYKRIGC